MILDNVVEIDYKMVTLSQKAFMSMVEYSDTFDLGELVLTSKRCFCTKDNHLWIQTSFAEVGETHYVELPPHDWEFRTMGEA